MPDKQHVVRCTLGGCYKYYHVDCVYKYKNVSCINSMKVSRFRCPLHYCEICQASGDSVLIVQCVLCPTSYHLKCLPQDSKAIRLTKKYIVCGSHNLNPDDFPKYEEKTPQQTYGKNGGQQSSLNVQNQSSLNVTSKSKRGRKPKSAVEQAGASDAEFEQQVSVPSVPQRSKNIIRLGGDSQ